MVLWLPSVLVSLTLFIRHSTRPFSIPSAPRGTREECNDDRRAETPERMGCGMERGLRDKHSIFRKLSVLQLYPCGWNNLGCMEVTASLITFKYLTYLYLIIMYVSRIFSVLQGYYLYCYLLTRNTLYFITLLYKDTFTVSFRNINTVIRTYYYLTLLTYIYYLLLLFLGYYT